MEEEEKKKEVEKKDEEGRSWRIKKEKVERKENGKEKGDKILLKYITFLISHFFIFHLHTFSLISSLSRFSPLHLLLFVSSYS